MASQQKIRSLKKKQSPDAATTTTEETAAKAKTETPTKSGPPQELDLATQTAPSFLKKSKFNRRASVKTSYPFRQLACAGKTCVKIGF